MKNKLVLLLSVCWAGTFSLLASATSLAAPLPASFSQCVAFPTEYDHGYYDGTDDATANKCNFQNNPGAYENWYQQAQRDALDNMNWAVVHNNQEYYDFWLGYYAGVQNGYYTQVMCGGNGGGGGTGPIGNEPYNPQ
jgi:hypothetical protein